MNEKQRLESELTALAEEYRVRYDAADRTVVLENVELGEGWTPRVITVEIKLSGNFPTVGPRVFLPGLLRCNGIVPRSLLVSGQYLVRGHLGDPIIYYPQWQPGVSTLTTVIETVLWELAECCGPNISLNSTENHPPSAKQ